ncbi:hypothetical protein [Roseovarius sp. MMSF_3350]|uniref:hypothetical protein n=1 Tax=Roseovarius sp. MMSF_3350 TaxID=3046706 RepID=UPI00273D9B45|nr:hypothetical protein [Roseovarius sp. MMSF_3350]
MRDSAQSGYEIGMLWVEGPLSYVEVLCAQSFLDAGHHVKLYHYKDVQNVPEGVELIHGDSVLKIDRFIQHGRTGSFALFSDVFRYHLLQQNDRMIWADLDAYCVKPFETSTGHFFGWESDSHINGGVLGLPPDSEALGLMLEMTEDEYGIPEWFEQEEQDRLRQLQDEGKPVHVSEMKWGTWGPHAVTHYLHKTGEAKYALPIEGLYPVNFRDRRKLMLKRATQEAKDMVTENTYSVHFYGRRVREFLSNKGGLPEPDSWMDLALKKHKVDCEAAPVLSREEKEEIKRRKLADEVETAPRLPTGKGGENLTDLADRFGSDQGTAKHRYTELYHMLFHPYRQRKITFVEMGLLAQGPEQGHDAECETKDCPSVRMWLEYFPKAEIHRLDVADLSGFGHERFTYHRCDMDERDSIAAAIEEIETPPSIVIDDASHASHHQQNAFLEVFPRLESGGLYIIEDLRWQPDAHERPGITKTAELFRNWVETRHFVHEDPKVAAELNKLAEDISGVHLAPARMVPGKRLQMAVIHKK